MSKLAKDFEPFRGLWMTTSDWMRWYDSWMTDPLVAIDAEVVERNVTESYKTIHKACKTFTDTPGNTFTFTFIIRLCALLEMLQSVISAFHLLLL